MNLIKIFERVQKIPYKVCAFDRDNISEDIKYGDCRHKSTLLKRLLEKEGYDVKMFKVIFDWKDLPLPKEILRVLKKSSTIWVHDIVGVKLNGNYILLDSTWDKRFERKGFPFTKKWSGLENTMQVTDGKLEFYELDDFNERKGEILKKHGVKINREEAHKFAEALNEWIED